MYLIESVLMSAQLWLYIPNIIYPDHVGFSSVFKRIYPDVDAALTLHV